MKQFRRFFTVALFGLIFIIPALGVAGEVGIFLRDLPECKIINSGETRICHKEKIISAGDVIINKEDPASMPIQWLSPSLVHFELLKAGYYRVVFTPPAEAKGVLSILGDLFGFARKAGRITNVAVTRSNSESHLILPGERATLLPGQPVTFSWCANGIKKITITTDTGIKVKEIMVPKGQRSLTMQTDDLGLTSNTPYRWNPNGANSGESGRIILLEKENAQVITDAFRSIDQEQGASEDKIIKKAAFIQFISENYSKDYSLGWLQSSIMSELPSQLAEDKRSAVNRLKVDSGVNYCW